jgi:hypothetical protein
VVVQTAARTTTHRASVINNVVSSEAGRAQTAWHSLFGVRMEAGLEHNKQLIKRDADLGACAVGGDERGIQDNRVRAGVDCEVGNVCGSGDEELG